MDTGQTYDPLSNVSATSSAPSILSFRKSKTSLPSVTAGETPPQPSSQQSLHEAEASRPASSLRRLGASLTLKLIGLVGVFVALPVVLYGQFESADAQRRELVARGIQHRTWLIAQAISPMLDQPDGPRHSALNSELQRYNDGRTILRLMFSPRAPLRPTASTISPRRLRRHRIRSARSWSAWPNTASCSGSLRAANGRLRSICGSSSRMAARRS